MTGDEMMVFCIVVLLINLNADPLSSGWEAYDAYDLVTINQALLYLFNLLVGVLILQYFRK